MQGVMAPIYGEVISLNESKKLSSIGKKIDYLILPKKNSTITQAIKEDAAWSANPKDTIHFPDEKNPIWFRLTVKHDGSVPSTFYLLFSSPIIDRFEMYYFSNGRWNSYESGEQILQKHKPIFSHLPAFPITLSPGERRTIYVKIESENPIFSFISIYNTKGFLAYSKLIDISFAAYFGAGGLMFLYSIFLAYSLRYKHFFFYFFYLCSILLVTLFATGFMQYIQIGNSHAWKNVLFPISIYFTSIFGLIFTAEFLELESFSKKTYRATFFLVFFNILLIPSILFLDLRTYIDVAMKFVIVPVTCGIYLALFAIFRNPRKTENYLFFLAFGSMLTGAGINIVSNQGWIKPLEFSSFSLPLGSAIEIALLAVALMLRVRDLRKENEEKQEIDSQLKVAKKLQKDLLPKHRSHLKGFPIGFRYLPTSDIGGDFVQFLEDEEGFGVFLCDVSGHGIAAAMIASMAKVSLQIWATELSKPALGAERMRISLLENLSGHFLSAIFLYVNPKKRIIKLANAGHHPIIFVSQDGKIETITTKGRAITDVIPLRLEEIEFPIPESGTIVLYTDGVLEARDPSNDELYGESRFLELLKEHANYDPQSICDRVVGDVFKFSKYKRADDDITIFALGLIQEKEIL